LRKGLDENGGRLRQGRLGRCGAQRNLVARFGGRRWGFGDAVKRGATGGLRLGVILIVACMMHGGDAHQRRGDQGQRLAPSPGRRLRFEKA